MMIIALSEVAHPRLSEMISPKMRDAKMLSMGREAYSIRSYPSRF
jgi:hypothetical protein